MVYFIGAGPGDVELITVKGMKLLQQADIVIYAGSLVNSELLGYCKKDVKIYDSASMDFTAVMEAIQQGADKDMLIVRLHTGDPSIYGTIKEQMDELDRRSIAYEIVPGVSSFLAAASRIKAEFTLPGVSQTVIITRLEGRTGRGEGGKLEDLVKHRASMAIFLSVQALDKVVEILKTGYGENAPIAVVYKATWPDEKIVKGTLADIVEKVKKENIDRFAQILVGDFINTGYEMSRLYAADFSHGFRSAAQSGEAAGSKKQ